MMTMIVFNKQQHISMVSRQRLRLSEYKSQVELNNRSLACGRCRLLSDWYCIGCQNNKKYPPITILSNICEYCPVPNYTSIVLTLNFVDKDDDPEAAFVYTTTTLLKLYAGGWRYKFYFLFLSKQHISISYSALIVYYASAVWNENTQVWVNLYIGVPQASL